MTSGQKKIKTFSIVLAIAIIITIFASTLSIIRSIIEINGWDDKDYITEEIENMNIDDFSKLNIDLEATSLEILEGEEFKIEKSNMNEKNLSIKKNKNGTLTIKERSFKPWHNENSKIKLYIKKGTYLDKLDIDMGAGKLEISGIKAQDFELDEGAGRVYMEDVAFLKADISGGAGRLEIVDSTLTNLDLSTGVGSTKLDGVEIFGKSEIDCGVGSITLNLYGTIDDYTIRTEKGIGSIKIDGEDANHITGNGPNMLDIEGGVGSITINFQKN